MHDAGMRSTDRDCGIRAFLFIKRAASKQPNEKAMKHMREKRKYVLPKNDPIRSTITRPKRLHSYAPPTRRQSIPFDHIKKKYSIQKIYKLRKDQVCIKKTIMHVYDMSQILQDRCAKQSSQRPSRLSNRIWAFPVEDLRHKEQTATVILRPRMALSRN